MMCCRRIDQRWFSRGSTPAISIGSAAGAGPYGERHPEGVVEVAFRGGVVDSIGKGWGLARKWTWVAEKQGYHR